MGFWSTLGYVLLVPILLLLGIVSVMLLVWVVPILLIAAAVWWMVGSFAARKDIKAASLARHEEWQRMREEHPRVPGAPALDRLRASFGKSPPTNLKPESPVLPHQYEVVVPNGDYDRVDCPLCDNGFVILHKSGTVHQSCPFCNSAVLESQRRPKA